MRNNVYSDIYVNRGIWFYQYELKIKNFRNFIYSTYEKLWGHDIINSLIWIFIRTGQEMFSEKMWNFKMSQLPYFLSDFHNFAPICREIFTLSFEIMIILDWTSPLRIFVIPVYIFNGRKQTLVDTSGYCQRCACAAHAWFAWQAPALGQIVYRG